MIRRFDLRRIIAPIILAGIFLIATIVRLSRIPELGYFMIDEERDAFLVRRLLVDHRPLLVGGVIPGGISIGPLFFYLSAIPYAISRLNPIGPAYAAGVLGVLVVLGTFVVGKSLFNRRVGLLAMIFGSFSLLNIIYHRPWWPLTFGQLVTLSVYLSLFRLIRKRPGPDVHQGQALKNVWLWILIIALIVGVQSDPSTLSFIPLSIIFLWMNRRSVPLSRKMIVIGLSLFFLAHVSLLIFDVRHDFQNTKTVLQFFSRSPSHFSISISNLKSVLAITTGVIYRLFIPTGPLDVTKQISPCIEFLTMRRDGVRWPGAAFLGVLLMVYVGRGIRSFHQGRQLLSLHVLIAFSGILFFTTLQPGYVHEWLWSFMFPALFLIMADMIAVLFKSSLLRISLLAVLAIWILSNLYLFSRLTNNAGLGGKLRAVQAANREIGNRPYELRSGGDPETGSDCFRYGGWRYLFTLQGNPPVKSYMDYVYEGWVYKNFSVRPDTIVFIANPISEEPTAFVKGVDQE